MPPQRDGTDACEDDAACAKTPVAIEPSSSYWETPDSEAPLKGKTLSTLDMSALESNHPDQTKKKKDDYWEATPEETLQGKTLSTLDMTLMGGGNNITEDTTINTDSQSLTSNRSSSSKRSIVAEEPDAAPSYWDDAPIDKSLQGMRLSSINIAAMCSNHPDTKQEKNDDYWGGTPKEDATLRGKTLSTLDMSALNTNHPDEHQQKQADYWGDAPIDKSLQGHGLSTLDMTALAANHPDEKKEKADSYWDAPEEEKLKGKRLSTIDMRTLEESNSARVTATEEEPQLSYWDDAPIEKSLKGQRLSAIDLEAMNKQRVVDDDKNDKKSSSSSPYWDWKGAKAIKKTLSKLSISNLRKGSAHDYELDGDDCVHGGNNGGRKASSDSLNSSGDERVKPITEKKHKLRDSWRRSFQRFSNNNLQGLDESRGSTGSGPRMMGKRIFKTSRGALDWSSGSRGSTGSIGEDAIMF